MWLSHISLIYSFRPTSHSCLISDQTRPGYTRDFWKECDWLRINHCNTGIILDTNDIGYSNAIQDTEIL